MITYFNDAYMHHKNARHPVINIFDLSPKIMQLHFEDSITEWRVNSSLRDKRVIIDPTFRPKRN